VKVKFSAQPFADGTDLRDFLIDALRGGEEHSSLTAVVAWAKRSGLSRLAPFLQDFRARGGTTRLIVGIDEGGATRQGLTLARELFSTVHIFHERTARTFHPKIYLATSDISARLLVGSNNLTAGGLFYNYEAGLWCDLDLTLAEDAELAESVQTYIARLYDDESVCLDLTDELLTTLIRNPEYRVERRAEEAGAAGTEPKCTDCSTTTSRINTAISVNCWPFSFASRQAMVQEDVSVRRTTPSHSGK
jgi:HKD family nuclease